MSNLKIFIKGFREGFKDFSHTITDIINFILLFFVYVLGIGSVSITSKLFGRHYIDLSNSGSSWLMRKLKKKQLEDYYRMF